jgi:hypothetical protein
MARIQSKRERIDLIVSQMETERSSFISHWRDCAKMISPRTERINAYDVNQGEKRNQNIIDGSATLASRTLRAGMMSGITSPARPWFRLTTPDPDLRELANVKYWTDDTRDRMNAVFLRSNLYRVLPITYGGMSTYASHAFLIEEDAEDTIRCVPFLIGSYSIAQNYKLQVDTFHRKFRMTARQIVQQFGVVDGDMRKIDWSKISKDVKDAFENGNTEVWFDVGHIIQPNDNYIPNSLLSKNKKYSSDYYEIGSSNSFSREVFLLEDGYDYFPVLVPRWEVNGEDTWGTNCPAMEALGDVQQLQTGEKRSLQAIEKMLNPPLIAPTSMKNKSISHVAGEITYSDIREGQQGLRSIYDVRFDVGAMENKQTQVRQRISRYFFEDLFLMLAQSDRRQITAREVEERHEEKLLALGPVLEQLNQDLLDPLVQITFEIMSKRGMLPPAPQELQGLDLQIEYVSVMAQAQKLVGLSSLERFGGIVANAAQFDPRVLDKVKSDQYIDEAANILSIPARVVASDEEVSKIRDNREQQQQQQAKMEQAQMGAKAIKDIAGADQGDILKQVLGG